MTSSQDSCLGLFGQRRRPHSFASALQITDLHPLDIPMNSSYRPESQDNSNNKSALLTSNESLYADADWQNLHEQPIAIALARERAPIAKHTKQEGSKEGKRDTRSSLKGDRKSKRKFRDSERPDHCHDYRQSQQLMCRGGRFYLDDVYTNRSDQGYDELDSDDMMPNEIQMGQDSRCEQANKSSLTNDSSILSTRLPYNSNASSFNSPYDPYGSFSGPQDYLYTASTTTSSSAWNSPTSAGYHGNYNISARRVD